MAAASEDDGDRLRSQDLPFGVIPIPKNVVLRVATINRRSCVPHALLRQGPLSSWRNTTFGPPTARRQGALLFAHM